MTERMTAQSVYHPASDPQFREPYVDIDEWREQPLRHRYVHGGFTGTETRFCFYFPPHENYAGRFFQHLAPVQCEETELQAQQPGEDDFISFCFSHGTYLVETNLGGLINGGGDQTLVYRCSAAAAEYSRQLAMEFYGTDRPSERSALGFEGTGDFRPSGTHRRTQWLANGTGNAYAEAEYTFTKPGLYFPIVKVAVNHRKGDLYTRVRNLARVRVVVL